jgi:hypothetical protein
MNWIKDHAGIEEWLLLAITTTTTSIKNFQWSGTTNKFKAKCSQSTA